MSVVLEDYAAFKAKDDRALREILQKEAGALGVRWDNNPAPFRTFVLEELGVPLGLYAVRSGDGVADVRAWLRADREKHVPGDAARAILSDLQYRGVRTFSFEPNLQGFDEKSERLIRAIETGPEN